MDSAGEPLGGVHGHVVVQSGRPVLQRGHRVNPKTCRRDLATWVPRASLVSALLVATGLPWAQHLGPSGPFLLGAAVVGLGLMGALWSVALRETGMAVANIVVGVLATPAVVALASLSGGP